MLGASAAATTASASTSHISEILRLTLSGISRSERQTIASGWMPMLRSAATECCVGLVAVASQDIEGGVVVGAEVDVDHPLIGVGHLPIEATGHQAGEQVEAQIMVGLEHGGAVG